MVCYSRRSRAAAAAGTVKKAPRESALLLHNREILIIEDNPADVRLMREALRAMEPPVTINVAADGEEALSFLRREGAYQDAPRPRLIFLDFNLPKCDSKDLLRDIKSDPNLRLIPIAVLTTSSSDRDVREAYHRFANCYLNKAPDLEGFFRVIQTAAHFWLDVASVPSDESLV
jgi:CheY-like chemotaxis protein